MMSSAYSSTPALETDIRWMRQALTLAEESVGLASPNPVVGCVLVQDELAVGRGTHRYDALDHAEVIALKSAGARAKGATAYVTLEPCAHTGRTGPCADALIASGVARVVVATGDPNPLVNGQGIARMRQHGIAVTVGVLGEQARALNNGFARYIRRRLPYVTLKAAVSLDGRIAPAAALRASVGTQPEGAGATVYITGARSLLAVQRMRHASDAVLTGIGTVLVDNPLLTDRSNLPRRRALLRVVLDSELRLPLESRLVQSVAAAAALRAGRREPQPFDGAAGTDLLVFTRDANTPKANALRAAGVEVEEAPMLAPGNPGSRHGLDLRPILVALGERRAIVNLMVEGGSRLNRAMLEDELVDRLCLFYAPLLLGDQGVPLVAGSTSLHPELHGLSLSRSGDDVLLEAGLRDPWR